jgi:outer membrane lipoprotein-sorting protein
MHFLTGAVVALVALLGVALAGNPAHALTSEERAALNAISERLSGVRTMNGDFVQFGQHSRWYLSTPRTQQYDVAVLRE